MLPTNEPLRPETRVDSTEFLRVIEPNLVCPACREPLRLDGHELVGTACGHRYPVIDGIARLAILGTEETWKAAPSGAGSGAYQQNYQKVVAAEGYNRAYQEKTLKRLSTRRELTLLRDLLGSQGRTRTLLNLPAGGGRLSGPLAETTDLLVEGDIAVGQLLYGAANRDWATPEVRMTASAFHIPLRDRGVTGTVCIRLCHHLPTPEERGRLLAELLRVSDRFVLMTFFDFNSPKNLLRRARRFIDHNKPKFTMRVAEVADIAARNGFTLRQCPWLSMLGSGHRYALLVRNADGS
ncbi:MAG TPA: Trm112 family protein [Candidatus Binatia bacterium]|jgi:hypothetical protein|nr:Trm112 family protein [Candidatus Binatia bacterium]